MSKICFKYVLTPKYRTLTANQEINLSGEEGSWMSENHYTFQGAISLTDTCRKPTERISVTHDSRSTFHVLSVSRMQ